MATMKELGDKYEPRLRKLNNFKIGKTGQTLKDRYDSEYSSTYQSREIIASSDSKSAIDKFEKYMINRFKDFSNCDNEQIGGGDMADSDKYIVYLMYNS